MRRSKSPFARKITVMVFHMRDGHVLSYPTEETVDEDITYHLVFCPS